MKEIKREQKYIGFVLSMVLIAILCFGLICVTAEPSSEDGTEPQPVQTPESSTEVSTDVPTDVPTDIPTDGPTDEPTDVPTEAPTDVPTDVPTDIPTDIPTDEPTDVPTDAPTDAPTEGPTQAPTEAPTQTTEPTPGETSATPSTESPTDLPTELPTETPVIPTTPMDTTPPFTMGPINSGDLLPENSPVITPGKGSEDVETPLNMNGYVLRVAATWDEYQDKCLDLEAIKAFEEKYNCKVQFLDLSEETLYNRLLMSCATGITYFDAILVEGTEILVNLEPLGLLQSFSKYMTEEEISALPISYQKFLTKENTLYGIPAKAPDMAGIWYNPAMIETYGYISPLSFYNDGQWSWYQATSLFKEATQDIDKNGYYDTYGIATSSAWYLSILESVKGSLFRWEGTRFIPGATNPVTLQGLSFARNVYANHYVASDYERYFYTGKTPYLAGELSMYTELVSWMETKDLLFLPYPSDLGTEPYTTVATSVPCAAITATTVYPEQTAELLKLLYGGEALTNRVETYCAESGFSEQIKTAYLKMLENFTVDYTDAFDPTGLLQTKVVSFLKNKTVTPSTVNKFVQPLLEEAIRQKQTKVDLTKVPVEIRW